MVSVIGCSTFLNCWLAVGVTNAGDVSVIPVVASVTDVVAPEAVPSDGRAGLSFEQAVETTSSASAQIPYNFSFMCSYRC
jgi:hypothetical protein